ncbi:hypothetical protein [Chamaesiphon sp.]|uniref:hypothetical protein n=1 Tax=Chamaesiphon sp. TaxID=2814140 RepID=UPI003593DD15
MKPTEMPPYFANANFEVVRDRSGVIHVSIPNGRMLSQYNPRGGTGIRLYCPCSQCQADRPSFDAWVAYLLQTYNVDLNLALTF